MRCSSVHRVHNFNDAIGLRSEHVSIRMRGIYSTTRDTTVPDSRKCIRPFFRPPQVKRGTQGCSPTGGRLSLRLNPHSPHSTYPTNHPPSCHVTIPRDTTGILTAKDHRRGDSHVAEEGGRGWARLKRYRRHLFAHGSFFWH